ncbi:hypothetical protein MMC17_000852 [Xylographa soralifera]|nr:hypothetical protein [Xylographa soralifera]
MSQLISPYMAQLPANYNTGLIKQFAPRINSSLTYERIEPSEFPFDCNESASTFYAHYLSSYSSTTELSDSWTVEACVPEKTPDSNFQATRDRQDVSEELYINITLPVLEDPQRSTTIFTTDRIIVKITFRTTVGYFELPNYGNGGVAGDLLSENPFSLCDSECMNETLLLNKSSARSQNTGTRTPVTHGPLQNLAIALFDQGSYIATRRANPSAYVVSDNNSEGVVCGELAPLVLLSDNSTPNSRSLSCITNQNSNEADVLNEVGVWLSNFLPSDSIRAAFTNSIFLSNQAMITQGASSPSLTIASDAGKDTQIPVISRTGVIVISVFLSLDLVALASMALYAYHTRTWTESLDAFAMMRLGAALVDKVPLSVCLDPDKIKVLDEIPGWVGDATPDEEAGMLHVGARGEIKEQREYHCYEHNHDITDTYPSPSKGNRELRSSYCGEQESQINDVARIKRSSQTLVSPSSVEWVNVSPFMCVPLVRT